MAKKPTKTQLKARLDRLCGAIVRSRGRCEAATTWPQVRCSEQLQWAHVEGRANLRLRWELWNALALCSGHHRWFTLHPLHWARFIAEHHPRSEALIRQHEHEKWNWTTDFEPTLKRLQEAS